MTRTLNSKLNLAFAIFLATTLSACSGSSSGPNTAFEPVLKAIPEKLAIDTSALIPATEAEAADGVALFKSVMVAHALQKHILVPEDESAAEKSRRLIEFNKLGAAQKAAVQSITSRCRLVENPSARRSSLTFRESINTSGSQCPVDLSHATQMTYTVQDSDSQGRTGSASISGDIQLHQQYNEGTIANAAGVSLSDLRGHYRGLTKIERSTSTTYFQILASGQATLNQMGPVQLSLTAESLGPENERTVVFYMHIKTPTHDYSFAARSLIGVEKIETLEFYSGDQKLTAKEAGELGAEDLIEQF